MPNQPPTLPYTRTTSLPAHGVHGISLNSRMKACPGSIAEYYFPAEGTRITMRRLPSCRIRDESFMHKLLEANAYRSAGSPLTYDVSSIAEPIRFPCDSNPIIGLFVFYSIVKPEPSPPDRRNVAFANRNRQSPAMSISRPARRPRTTACRAMHMSIESARRLAAVPDSCHITAELLSLAHCGSPGIAQLKNLA